MSDGIEVRAFGDETERDAVAVVNEYIAGWPYCRPVDAELVTHWKEMGPRYQPEQMLIAYSDGSARAFAHGERDGGTHFVHLLAMAPGAVEEGVHLLGLVEARARREGVKRICGPTCTSGRFYGGYVLGLEPYHPHWATEGTEAFVQAGFAISQSEAFMVADLTEAVTLREAASGYEVVEATAEPEFVARTFRLAAMHEGKEVATCGGRMYPKLKGPRGGVVGQLGFVGTDEAHRGKGLATALVTRALARLRAWGTGEVLISTGLENGAALRAYERAGFRRKHNLNEWSKVMG